MKMPAVHWISGVETAEGCFRAIYSEHGLAGLGFPGQYPKSGKARSRQHAPESMRDWIRLTQIALHLAIQGKQPSHLPPLDLTSGSLFQQEVWQFLLTIPPGEVRTYGDIARALDRPGASRAVGQACGANPIAVLVPCHRVIAAHGALGGYSAGLAWKQRLLEREDVRFETAS